MFHVIIHVGNVPALQIYYARVVKHHLLGPSKAATKHVHAIMDIMIMEFIFALHAIINVRHVVQILIA